MGLLQVGVGEGRWQGSVVMTLVVAHWWGDSGTCWEDRGIKGDLLR